MPATVDITRWTGTTATPVKTVITNQTTRANAEDSPTSSTGNPIQIPASGATNYSYWVSTRLTCSVLPATLITNLRWYGPGTNNLAGGCGILGNSAAAAPGYTQATGTLGQTGTQLTQANYPALAAAPVSVFTFTSAAPKALNGQMPAAGPVGDFGDFFVYQITVPGATAVPGPTGTALFTWQYDES
jgi:hypothetical protein